MVSDLVYKLGHGRHHERSLQMSMKNVCIAERITYMMLQRTDNVSKDQSRSGLGFLESLRAWS